RPFVFWMPRVPSHPMPLYLMLPGELVEAAPQVLVLDRLLVSRSPCLAFPGMDPLGNALLDVLRIGVKEYPARPLERLECADYCCQLHAVVGGGRLATPQLLFTALGTQDDTPAARPGIAPAGAVGEDFDGFTPHGGSGASVAAAAPGRGAARAPDAM